MRLFSLTMLLAAGSPAAAQWALPADFKALKPEDLRDVAPTPPPDGAVVLFDGKSFDRWVKKDGKSKAGWRLLRNLDSRATGAPDFATGIMEVAKGEGDIITKETFGGKFRLHAEFRVPYQPKSQGQDRGNSGVYLQGRYEVQILDSYGAKSGKNDCAAIYDVHPPSENACKAPTVWQSYDIAFTAPKYENGRKAEPARMTVTHNGVKVHDGARVDVDNTRAGMGGDPKTPGPILLQDHGHPVQFRNVWLLPTP